MHTTVTQLTKATSAPSSDPRLVDRLPDTPSSQAEPAGRLPGVGFWAIAAAFAAIMGFSAVPTPLYGLYAARDGFGSLTITIVYAVYAVGVILALFTVGHLSDWYGRRRMMLPTLLIAALSGVLFLVWRDLTGLIVPDSSTA